MRDTRKPINIVRMIICMKKLVFLSRPSAGKTLQQETLPCRIQYRNNPMISLPMRNRSREYISRDYTSQGSTISKMKRSYCQKSLREPNFGKSLWSSLKTVVAALTRRLRTPCGINVTYNGGNTCPRGASSASYPSHSPIVSYSGMIFYSCTFFAATHVWVLGPGPYRVAATFDTKASIRKRRF